MIKKSLALTASLLLGAFSAYSAPEKEKPEDKKSESVEYLDSRALPYAHAGDSFYEPPSNLRGAIGSGSDEWNTKFKSFAGRLGMNNLPSLSGRFYDEKAGFDDSVTTTDLSGSLTEEEGAKRKNKAFGVGAEYASPAGKFGFAFNKGKREISEYFNWRSALMTTEDSMFDISESNSASAQYSTQDISLLIGYLKNKSRKETNSPTIMDTGMGILRLEDSRERESTLKSILLSGDYLISPDFNLGTDVLISKRDETSYSRVYNLDTTETDEIRTDDAEKPLKIRARALWIPEGVLALSGSAGLAIKNRKGDNKPIADIMPTLNFGEFGFGGSLGQDSNGNLHYTPFFFVTGDKKNIHQLNRFMIDQLDFLENRASRDYELHSRATGTGASLIIGAQLYKDNDSRDLSNPDKEIKHARSVIVGDIGLARIIGSADIVTETGESGVDATVTGGLNFARIIGLEGIRLEALAGLRKELRKKFTGETIERQKVDRQGIFYGLEAGFEF